MTVMRLHDREPVQKHYRQRQAMFLCRLRRQMTKIGFGQSQNYIRLEILNGLVQGPRNRQRPDKIFVISDPRSQSRPEAALSQSVDEIGEPQGCMHQKVVGKVSVAGNVQFKRIPLHQVPMQHDENTAIIFGRNNANEQNATFCCHRELGGNRGMPVRPPMLLAIVAKSQAVCFFIQKASSSDLELTASAISKHRDKANAASSSHSAGRNTPHPACRWSESY